MCAACIVVKMVFEAGAAASMGSLGAEEAAVSLGEVFGSL